MYLSELLHFAPLFFIAAIMFSSSFSGKKSLMVFILSIVGLVIGSQMHSSHVLLLDPCFGYIASALCSGVSIVAKRLNVVALFAAK